ncbi:MAG: S1C family serine protease [Planctomycetota bacterium]|jgi:S1-C subfamily serine protease
MTEIRKLKPETPSEVAFYDGYQAGHKDTVKMLARRSAVYLLAGLFLGLGCMFLIQSTGALDSTEASEVVEDPALDQEKPTEYVKAIKWGNRFTVGIVAETSDQFSRVGRRYARIPGQSHVGSGVVMSKDGYILTNSHVIPSNVKKLNVVLGDEMYEARFVGHRSEYDLAVIKIVADELPEASLGDSDKVEQGDISIAIGSPHGLFHTATEGIISYVGRRSGSNNTLVRNFLQTSAAINHGNSGGPLIDLTGRVIGINTWKLSDEGTDSIDGIGFAIPINIARRVYDDIVRSDDKTLDNVISSVPRSIASAFLGVRIETGFRPEMSDEGAKIIKVIYGTAADRAGLRAGDVITAINNQPVRSFDELASALSQLEPGLRVTLTYLRDGKGHSIELNLGE